MTKEYLVRKINTRGTFFLEGELPRDVVDEDWGSIIEYIGIGAAVIIFLCFLGVLSCIWNFIKGQGLQDEEFTLKGLLMAIAVFAVIAWVAGHFSGSKIIIDNATDQPVKVFINGDLGRVLPAKSFLSVRIRAESCDLQIAAEEDGAILETASLEGLGGRIYNICGHNSYSIDTKVYSTRRY